MSVVLDKLERYAYCFFKGGGAVTLAEWGAMSEGEMEAFIRAKARADGVVTSMSDGEAASVLADIAEARASR